MTNPYNLISIVMSVFNGEQFLRTSVESMLNQTYINFEFIIVNDGSVDNTFNILKKYAKKDLRIKIINNDKNIGLTKSLNKGLKIAKGKFIARMDADDISLPERLEKQLSFMEIHSEIGAVGCWYYLIDKYNKIIKECRPPRKYSKIKKALIKKAIINSVPLIHPGLMIRKDALEKINFYDENFIYAQDRDLLFRILKYYKIAVVPEILFKLRISDKSISAKNEIEQKKYCIMAKRRAINIGIYPKHYYIYIFIDYILLNLPWPINIIKKTILKKLGIRKL